MKRLKKVSCRVINIQHITLNDAAQSAKLCISIGAKVDVTQKNNT